MRAASLRALVQNQGTAGGVLPRARSPASLRELHSTAQEPRSVLRNGPMLQQRSCLFRFPFT